MTTACPSDGTLLRAFVAHQDQTTFTALVKRHGPMVLGICRRRLHDLPDAEDAFQATFLMLARKASTLSRRESLAGWLHEVACHIARDVRRAGGGGDDMSRGPGRCA